MKALAILEDNPELRAIQTELEEFVNEMDKRSAFARKQLDQISKEIGDKKTELKLRIKDVLVKQGKISEKVNVERLVINDRIGIVSLLEENEGNATFYPGSPIQTRIVSPSEIPPEIKHALLDSIQSDPDIDPESKQAILEQLENPPN